MKSWRKPAQRRKLAGLQLAGSKSTAAGQRWRPALLAALANQPGGGWRWLLSGERNESESIFVAVAISRQWLSGAIMYNGSKLAWRQLSSSYGSR